jgi:flagellar hook-associated protein 2
VALSSPGIGSNLDVNGIVSQLMSLEQKPLIALARREASFQAKLSAIGSLKGALSSFQSSAKGLADISKFQALRVAPADTTIVSASATATAIPGTYALEVTKLAQAQKLASAGQASTSAVIGNGTLAFDFGAISGGTFDPVAGKYTGAAFTSSGTGVKTVTIDATNNTLSGIREAINKANVGISATIVNDGSASPNRLVLTEASTGKTNSVKISVTGDAALSGLLAHDPAAAPAGQALSETVTAQNAEIKVDGIAASKSSNSITDVIPGVTLNLLKTNAGSPTTISVARDTASVVTAVSQFVSAYNQINSTLKDLSAYNPTTKQGAVLNGDAAVRNIQSQVRGILNAPVAGGASVFTQLSQIGVTVQKDGTLAADSTKLQAAVDANFNDIAGLFAAVGKATDSLVTYSGSTANTKSGAYALNVTQLATTGKTAGQAAAGLTITAGSNDTLQVLLDGVSASVTLTAGAYATAAALATEVQSKINGAAGFVSAGSAVTVTQSAGVINISSNRYGSASNVSVTGNGQANLLGATPTTTAGVNVAGTINGIAAAGSGQTLTGATGNVSEGLKLLIPDGALGARGTVNFSKGYAYQFDKMSDSILGTNGSLAARTDGINASLKSITQDKQRVTDRLTSVEARYRAQFTALDLLMSNMTKTSSFLTQQLAGISNLSKN